MTLSIRQVRSDFPIFRSSTCVAPFYSLRSTHQGGCFSCPLKQVEIGYSGLLPLMGHQAPSFISLRFVVDFPRTPQLLINCLTFPNPRDSDNFDVTRCCRPFHRADFV
jgi:hypothetical protein